jgi:NAD(P)-dependent dehydrogenase (short-subunit alcohol dehydrogenase family)
MSLAGKKVVVVGGSSGIGLSTAELKALMWSSLRAVRSA